jgi:hypothetical protein
MMDLFISVCGWKQEADTAVPHQKRKIKNAFPDRKPAIVVVKYYGKAPLQQPPPKRPQVRDLLPYAGRQFLLFLFQRQWTGFQRGTCTCAAPGSMKDKRHVKLSAVTLFFTSFLSM